jgi:hypothetical protein
LVGEREIPREVHFPKARQFALKLLEVAYIRATVKLQPGAFRALLGKAVRRIPVLDQGIRAVEADEVGSFAQWVCLTES